MEVKMRIIKFVAAQGSYLPWRVLDCFQPKSLRMLAFKNEIVIEKYLRQGRENAGKKGVYELHHLKYEYTKIDFNIINKVVSFCTWCYLNGYAPNITVKQAGTEHMLWTMLFDPILSNGSVLKRNIKRETLNIVGPRVVFDKRLLAFWRKSFSKWVIPHAVTEQYCNNEYEKILKGKRCLGVLVRGTDYTTLKPRGHGIQPQVEQVMEKVRKKLQDLRCDYIYLATEEKRIYDLFDREFPEKVLINKRVWYDEYYQGHRLIGEIQHNRENDSYLSTLEYFSSIFLLSKCTGLIAGNCGGSVGAALMNGGEYEYMHIFDLGTYQ